VRKTCIFFLLVLWGVFPLFSHPLELMNLSLQGGWQGAGEDVLFPGTHIVNNPEGEEVVLTTKLEFPPSLKDHPKGLYLGRLPGSTEVYWNGSLLLRSGTRPPEPYFAPIFKAHYLILPEGLTHYDGPNLLELNIYSEHPYNVLPAMFLSSPESVRNKSAVVNFFNPRIGVVITGTCMVAALYFLVLFILNTQALVNLYAFMGTLGFALNSTILYLERSIFSYEVTLKLQYIGLQWGVTAFLLFIMTLVKIKARKVSIFLTIATSVVSLVLLLIPSLWATIFFNDRLVYPFWTVPQLILILYLTLRGVQKKVVFAPLLLFGAVTAILGGGRDIFLLQMGNYPEFYTNLIGLFVLIVCIFIAYAAQFHKTQNLLQQRTVRLVELTSDLESMVKERTRQLEEANHDLTRQALTDPLTGVSNRLEYSRIIEQEQSRYQRTGSNYGILYVDLDDFKKINDSYGHPQGDRILIEACGILNSCIRSSDYLFRMGGDEFLILMTEINEHEDAQLLAMRILEEAAAYSQAADGGPPVVLSIGACTTYRIKAPSLHELTRHADLALLEAKRSGKSRYTICDGSLS